MAPQGTLAPHPFDAAPMRGRRHLQLMVEKEDEENQYSFMFLGNTWPFKDSFAAANISGGYIEGTSPQEYVRTLRNIAYDEVGKNRIAQILTVDVLHGHTVLLLDEVKETEDSMIKWLVSLASVHRR